jgi:excinuclease UvrABC nuclease subunit
VRPICDRKSWEGTPFSYKAGCYALYAQDGDLLYVGKASLFRSVGSRLWHHFQKSSAAWMPNTALVQIVEVAEPYEAPSLEEYLIRELQPRWNGTGRLKSN